MSALGKRTRTPRASGRPGLRARWVVGVLVLLLLAGVGGWLLTRSDGAAPAASGASTTDEPIVPKDQGQAVELSSAAPAGVPATVPADVPGLPAAEEPVALSQTTEFGNGVRARLVEMRAVEAHARMPGEVTGPALRVTVELTNTTSSPVPVDAVGVNLYTGTDGAPTSPITEQAGLPLHGELAPGGSAQGTYAFTVPENQRDLVTVTVALGPQVGTAVFSGSAR